MTADTKTFGSTTTRSTTRRDDARREPPGPRRRPMPLPPPRSTRRRRVAHPARREPRAHASRSSAAGPLPQGRRRNAVVGRGTPQRIEELLVDLDRRGSPGHEKHSTAALPAHTKDRGIVHDATPQLRDTAWAQFRAQSRHRMWWYGAVTGVAQAGTGRTGGRRWPNRETPGQKHETPC